MTKAKELARQVRSVEKFEARSDDKIILKALPTQRGIFNLSFEND